MTWGDIGDMIKLWFPGLGVVDVRVACCDIGKRGIAVCHLSSWDLEMNDFLALQYAM